MSTGGSGMAAGGAGMATRRSWMAAGGYGMAAGGCRMAAGGSGMAAGVSRMAAVGSEMANGGSWMATSNVQSWKVETVKEMDSIENIDTRFYAGSIQRRVASFDNIIFAATA